MYSFSCFNFSNRFFAFLVKAAADMIGLDVVDADVDAPPFDDDDALVLLVPVLDLDLVLD